MGVTGDLVAGLGTSGLTNTIANLYPLLIGVGILISVAVFTTRNN